MPVEQLTAKRVASTRAMASTITIQAPRRATDERDFTSSTRRAFAVFHDVEAACTRFVASSPLMRTNATPTRWHRVPECLYLALSEAYGEYLRTHGVFDPRVLADLEALGYDATLRFDVDEVSRGARDRDQTARSTWAPLFRPAKCDVRVGEAVELGGIGKGLAVRWASQSLADTWRDFLIEAGGDCYVAGRAPDGAPWRVGVQDPLGGDDPIAVLAVSDRAVVTSSIRVRRWRVGDDVVHHLIDPRTRASGGAGLASVTVVGDDPARAEVDAKVLFLAGRRSIARVARRENIATLWCDDQGRVGRSETLAPYVIWERS